MNIDLRLIVRLLLAILLASLVSTILMGSQIHKRIVESIAIKINQKDIPKTDMSTRQLPKREILKKPETSPPILTLTQNELDILKIYRHGNFHLPKQKAIKDWHYCLIKEDTIGTGLGEQGKAALLPNSKENEATEVLYGIHGYNAKLCDLISLNRSLPDIRPLG